MKSINAKVGKTSQLGGVHNIMHEKYDRKSNSCKFVVKKDRGKVDKKDQKIEVMRKEEKMRPKTLEKMMLRIG